MKVGRARAVTLSLALGLGLGLAISVALGSVEIPILPMLLSLVKRLGLPFGRPMPPPFEAIFWSVRLPRVLIAALVGGGLAVVGGVLQAVFRNPIADSGLLGVGSGAAFGAVLAVRLGWAERIFLALPAAAFLGAMGAILAIYAISRVIGRHSLEELILTGIAVSALGSAGVSLLLVATEEYRVKAVLFWLAGGLEGRSWPHLEVGLLLMAPGVVVLLALGRPLDLLSLGSDEAASLGLRVREMRLLIFALSALVAGAATSIAGSVPFVGLIAPHALRPFVGPVARRLLPASFLAGALLVVLADLGARTLSNRLDLPLGSLTAIVGAPYFLLALRGAESRS